MVTERPDFEQRLASLLQRVEHLRQQAEGSSPAAERRLTAMADQYAEHLERWASTVERQSRAVTQLESCVTEWTDTSTQVRQHTAERLQALDAAMEREWETLKAKHEAPLQALQGQVESLTQASMAMISASQQGVGRAAERFTSFEAEVRLRLDEMAREFGTAVADMKARLGPAPTRDALAEWSFEDVTRLHGQLRGGDLTATALPLPLPLPVGAHPDDNGLFEPEAAERAELPTDGRRGGGLLTAPRVGAQVAARVAAAAVLGLTVVGGGVFAWRLQSQLEQLRERALVAEQKADLAMSDSARQNDEMRRQAVIDATAHREMAARTARVADVIAAPDLVRLSLFGANGASGHALFSRSRGLVVSGNGLQQSGDRVLQAWLLTPAAPVKVGHLVAEPDGTFVLAQALSATPQVPIVGVMVTSDPASGGEGPGRPVLTSARAVQPTEVEPSQVAASEPLGP